MKEIEYVESFKLAGWMWRQKVTIVDLTDEDINCTDSDRCRLSDRTPLLPLL